MLKLVMDTSQLEPLHEAQCAQLQSPSDIDYGLNALLRQAQTSREWSDVKPLSMGDETA
jgi:hypothetical protein